MTEPLDVAPLLDPAIRAALAAFPFPIGDAMSALSDELLPVIRSGFGATPTPPLSGNVEWTDHTIPNTEGVVVRVHRPKNGGSHRPCVYWMHGGGLVIGSYTQEDLRFDRWCAMFDCVGVSVEYRLSPEAKYPEPIEDCYAGLAWVHQNAESLGIDPSRIGIGGNSAGGGLAAGLGLLARDRGEYPVAFQLLIYPMIDDRQITVSSQWADPIWPPSANAYGWGAYLGDSKGTADVPIYAAAARATDLRGLPATLISVGALDGFSDEDIDYAVRLRHAGVPTELHVYPGACHGFDALAAGTPVADRATRDIDEWLAAHLS